LRRDRTSLYVSPGHLTLRIIPALAPSHRGLSIAIAVSAGGR
jgi:hypothetical protein